MKLLSASNLKRKESILPMDRTHRPSVVRAKFAAR